MPTFNQNPPNCGDFGTKSTFPLGFRAKIVILWPVMATLLLIIASLAGIAVSVLYLRKNIIRIKAKNANEPKAYKRGLNYVLTGLWYGYLLVFFVGLTVNNLIF